MKNLYLLAFTLFIFGSIHGQKNKNNYDSKWFIGFNYGATWSSSDIDNSWDVREPQSESLRSTNPTGWSLFLGKSYNYEYGKMLSFDLRGRYLRGHWYGQNTELDSSMTSNIGEVQDIYDQYNSAYGGFIPNYYTKLDRLSLELVIHLNRLREKTGVDPYIFGGLGFSWKSIMADLTTLDETGDTPLLYSEEQMLNNDLDFDYETNLIDRQKYFMPSLGFGLAYDFGNASIGLEHKTTFTRGDQFDGYISEAPRLENDLYHYTSAFVRFRLGGSNNTRPSQPAPKPPASASDFTSCPTPVVDILNANNTSSSSGTLVINAKLTNVNSVSQIKLTDKNNMTVPFDYDPTTNNVTATVSLVLGNNTFTLEATTNCGSDVERLNIQNTNNSSSGFTSCPSPIVNIFNSNNASVAQGTMIISAQVENVNNGSEIKLRDGNQLSLPFNFDVNTKLLTATVTLVDGNNVFNISASNECGSDARQITVQYTNISCPSPVVNILNTNNVSITQGTMSITAQVENINDAAEIKLLNANQVYLPFSFNANTNMLTASVTLVEGNNIFYVSASNNCGSDAEQITVQHTNITCPSPEVNVLNGNNSSVAQGTISISAQIENINAISEISFTNANQVALPFNYDFNTRTMTASVSLMQGSNTFYISAINNCGGDTDQINIEYTNAPCPSPVVNILNANDVQVNQGVMSISAQILNVNSASEILFTDINQNPLLFSYNLNTNVFSASVTLAEGNNTFFISAANNCGSDTDRLNIEYTNCKAPTGVFMNLGSTTVESPSVMVQASILEITDGAMVRLFVNNNQVFGFNFNPSTGLLQSNLSLEPGQNLIRIDFANDCGQGTINQTIIYNQCETPLIELIHPSASGATSNNQNQNIDIQITGTDVTKNNITLKLNGKPMNLSAASFTNQLLSFSLVLIPGINTISVDVQNDCGSDSEVFTIDFENCIPPSIVFNGVQTGLVTMQQSLALNITMNEIFGSQNISYKLNGKNLSGLQFNPANNTLSGSISLVPGDNYFTVSASNDCGTAIETLHIIYNDCKDPTISITSMGSLTGGTNVSVSNPAYTIMASLSNVQLNKEISVKHNGKNINFSFVKGKLSSNVTLGPGLNTFNITVHTPCGEASENLTIVYDDCQPPSITLKVPTSNSIQSTSQKVQIIAKISNITSMSQISLVNGGTAVPFALNNGILKAQVTLTDGINSVVLKAKNPCGEDTESISISYEPCLIPQIVLTSSTPSVVMTSSVPLTTVSINNYAASTTVTISVNGHSISSAYYQISNGNLTGNIPLISGMNTISIYAVSPCGSDSETISILRCKNPSVNWINPALVNTVVTSESFTLQAMANNAFDASNIQLVLNGSVIQFDYNGNTELLSATVNLMPGNNVFAIRIENTCGAANSNIKLIYQPGNNGSNGNNGNSGSNGLNGSNGNSGSNGSNGNNNSNGNNGHGNNGDGIDVSNPGQGNGGPNGQNDPSGNVDDENQQGNGSGNMGTNGNNGGQNNKSQTPTPSKAPKGNSGSKNTTAPKGTSSSGNKGSGVKSNKPSGSSNDKGTPSPKIPNKNNGKGKGR